MSETRDPTLDAVRHAARVHDTDLDTSAIRAAIADLTPSPRRRHPARVALVAAAAVSVAAFGGWQAVAPSGDQVSAKPIASDRTELVAARFDAAAAEFPLPTGQSYTALRAEVLSGTRHADEFVVGEGRMPQGNPDTTAALVARYSGCKWWKVETTGNFADLSAAEKAEIRQRGQQALAEVLKVTKNPDGRVKLSQLWDQLCQDVE